MWKINLKHLTIFFILILSLNLFSCKEDLDLNIEDAAEEYEIQETQKEQIRSRLSHDDEEFDNPNLLHEQKKRSIPDPGDMPNIPTNMQGVQQPESEKRLHFAFYEVVMVIFLIAFILNCFWGKATNESLAQRWYNTNKTYLEDSYAHIGVSSEYNTKGSVPMLKESYNNYKFYASGRMFIRWLLVNMDFKKRQDLVTLCTNLFLFSEKDKIVYEASIIPPQDLPMVFCICKKKDAKTLKKNYSDIDFFTKAYYPSFFSNNLVFLTEDMESFDSVFGDKNFLSLFNKVQPFIDVIFLTDRQSYSKESHSIFFSFDLTGNMTDEEFFNLTLFVHQFVDLLCTARISSSFKKEAEKNRVEFNKIRSKELQVRNAEEMRQKKLDKQNSQTKKSLTIEQAQKLEEKNKKEALKEQKKKQFKVIKK